MQPSLQDRLAWAEALAKGSQQENPPDEMMARDSIRVAYYAVFHAFLAWAKSRGYVFPNDDGTHHCLWVRWYGADPKTKKIKRRAMALYDKRIIADYEVDTPLNLDPIAVMAEVKELCALLTADINRVRHEHDEPLQRTLPLAPKKTKP